MILSSIFEIQIQGTLLDLGAHIATPRTSSKQYRAQRTLFVASVTSELERTIDVMDAMLPPLKNFVLPVEKLFCVCFVRLLCSKEFIKIGFLLFPVGREIERSFTRLSIRNSSTWGFIIIIKMFV